MIPHAQLRLRAHHCITECEQEPAEQTQQRCAGSQPQTRPSQPEPEEHGKKCGGRHERPPQTVEQPPAIHRTKAPAAPEQPRQILPVAAHPALHPRIIPDDGGGEAIRQLYVTEIAAAQVRALQRVMRQNAVFRHGAVAAGEQRVNVEDALAGEPAAVIAIHIQLAAMRSVGIRAALPGEQPREIRLYGAFQLNAHPRVQKTVALCDRAAPMVDHGRRERMQHRADELDRRAGTEKAVAVEGDEVSGRAQLCSLSADRLQIGLHAAQEPGKRKQRAALALVPAPHAVRHGEPALAGEEIIPAAVPAVEGADRILCRLQDRVVMPVVHLAALRQICQQTEQKVPAGFAVAEVKFLQPTCKRPGVVGGGNERRDHAQRFSVVRHAAVQRKPRQETRRRDAQQKGVQSLLDQL